MDGYRYKGVLIGDQCWFAENLRTTVYADGSSIPEVTDNSWTGLSTGARCTYANDPSVPHGYGLLYNWYAVDNASGLCPNGWHVPTDGEWTDLETYITSQGFSVTEGTALKSAVRLELWRQRHGRLWVFGPSGRLPLYDNGYFAHAGARRLLVEFFAQWRRCLVPVLALQHPGIYRYATHPRFGFSVRCLRDAD